MSRARVDQIVNQLGTGSVEFPEGLQVSAGKILKIGGPVEAYGGTTGTAGQILKAGSNSELIWGDSDTVTLTAGDGSNSSQQQVILRGGDNVTLVRSVNEIIIDSSFVNDNTVTRLQASGGTLVSGDIVFTGVDATTVAQTGQTIQIGSTDTTYTAGTGITLTDQQFSIAQEIETTSTPTFAALTLTGNIGAVNGNFSGDVSGTWTGGTIPIDKGGTGNTTASAAFLGLAPSVGAHTNRFLKTDGSNIFWSDLPATGGFTPKTYDLTGESDGSVNQAKIRLTDNDGLYDDVTLVGQNDITITRSGNTINFGSSFTDNNDNDYVDTATLTGTNLVLGRTGSLADLTVDLSTLGGGGGGGDTDSTYDLDTQTTSGGASIRLIPGGDALGDPIKEAKIIGGANATVTRETNGDITIAATDTDNDTITRLKITGPGTTGGAFVSGDISLQASGSTTLVQSGNIIAISSDNSNSYVDNAYYNAISGALTLERTDSLQDINLPVSNLQAYFDTRYVTSGGLADAKITSASFSTTSGNLTLTPNDGTGSIIVNLDGRYVTTTGDNYYVTSGTYDVVASSNPPGYHVSRPLLRLGRNDSTNVDIETEPLLDYLDTLYAPISSSDTRVDAFTFNNGSLYLSVSNGDEYTHNLDNRYIRSQDYIAASTFNTTDGVLTFTYGWDGATTARADMTVDLDGRYKLLTAADTSINSLTFNPGSGNLYATKTDGSNTGSESLDGRYIDTVTFSNNQFSFQRQGGSTTTVSIPEGRIDVPDGTSMLVYGASAPTGWTKVTSVNDVAIRVVNGSGGGSSSGLSFSTCFAQNINTGGAATNGNLGVSGNVSSQFGSGFGIDNNLTITGNPNASYGSGASVTNNLYISGNPEVNMGNISFNSGNLYANSGNFYARSHSVSNSQMPWHGHNYIEGRYQRRGNSTDDGRANVISTQVMVSTAGSGGGSGHGHYIDGTGNVSGSPGYSGSINAARGNLDIAGNVSFNPGGITVERGNLGLGGDVNISGDVNSTLNASLNGQVGFTAGNIDLNVSYVDVIICTRNPSGG
jgi:hypothetical protein